MHEFSRRSLVAAPLFLGAFGSSVKLTAAPGELPHFYLQVVINGGADTMYMFDSRPYAFRSARKIANFAKAEGKVWTGSNGGQCLAAVYSDGLRKYKDKFSVINGVVMPFGIEGHNQVNSLLTGSPFAGDFFATQLSSKPLPLTYLGMGNFTPALFQFRNRSGALILPEGAAPLLSSAASKRLKGKSSDLWRKGVLPNAQSCSTGEGKMSQGCDAYTRSFALSGDLAKNLAAAGNSTSAQETSELIGSVQAALGFFKNGMTNAAVIDYNPPLNVVLDTHGGARDADRTFTILMSEIERIFETLVKTPYDASKGISMLDVTTVLISSEFARTNQQLDLNFDNTGTDHNPLSNTIILAGKGIKSDIVLGATDLDALDEKGEFKEISAAHRKLDTRVNSRMGKVFDFAKQEVRSDLPEDIDPNDYITMQSIINTVMATFDCPVSSMMANVVGGKAAAILSKVLS